MLPSVYQASDGGVGVPVGTLGSFRYQAHARELYDIFASYGLVLRIIEGYYQPSARSLRFLRPVDSTRALVKKMVDSTQVTPGESRSQPESSSEVPGSHQSPDGGQELSAPL